MSTIRTNIRVTVHYVPKIIAHAWTTIRNKPVEWVDVETDEVVSSNRWKRRYYWSVFRPRYYGFVNPLECGCTRRFGRIIMYRLGCPENHGGLTDLMGDLGA